MARKAISQKLRFEVFKRDSFTCQYCGRSAPKVVLEVDHLTPVSKGGANDVFNLITSCKECNRGKGKRKIDDNSVLSKQLEQLKELNEKRKQMEMMAKWRKELSDFDNSTVEYLVELFESLGGDSWRLNENGKAFLRRLLKKYSTDEIVYAFDVSIAKYTDPDEAFDYMERVCKTQRAKKDKPYLADLFYIRATILNRFDGQCWPKWKILKSLEQAHLNGLSIQDAKTLSQHPSFDWFDVRDVIVSYMEDNS